MKRTIRNLGVWALALCALFTVMLGTSMARADGTGNTLTVVVAREDDENYADLTAADIVVDVFKVASLTTAGNKVNYTLESSFSSLDPGFTAALDGEGDWQAVSEAAANLVADATADPAASPVTGDEASPINLPEDGIYLVLARGASEPVGSNKAYSATRVFEFQPSLIALPTKAAGEDGVITTAEDHGEWLTELTIYLKYSSKPLYGSLRIIKTVTEQAGTEPATFNFRVADVETDGQVYEGFISITYPDQTEATLGHIPAGLQVKITETYEGARYRFVGYGDGGNVVTIIADRLIEAGEAVPTVEVINEPNGNHTYGHGIENHFEYDRTTGDWPLTQRPAPRQ